MCDINDDVFLYHIFPYINYKDRYSVSFVNKLFTPVFFKMGHQKLHLIYG